MQGVTKTCSLCKGEKPISNFYRRDTFCKTCRSDRNRENYEKNVDKIKAHNKANRHKYKHKKYAKPSARTQHSYYLKFTYGIDIDIFEAILAEQGGVCAICRGECNRSTTTRLCVDHDHSTGSIRGLLCFQCNVGLGKFKDDPKLLEAARAYLASNKIIDTGVG